ncbi:MAG TPA: HEAT repeat domain-containing protein, partial [Polyangiales bacterium]|nr:HEAT repeat domain-containing protein [Polyangiales bacterium]
MRARRRALRWTLFAALIASSPAQIHAQDEGWVEAFSTLRMRPGFGDSRSSLAERLQLARALGRHGPEADAVAALLAGLKADPAVALRDELLLALARRAAPDARAALRDQLAALTGPASATGATAKDTGTASLALALGTSDDASTIDALVRALAHPASARVAEEALLRIGAASVPRLAAALASPQLALSATRVLAALGPRALGARAALERALRSDSAALRAAAAHALGQSESVASAGALVTLLGDEAEVAQAALEALARVATADQAQALIAVLARSQGERRALALRALATASPAQALPALRRALRDGDAGERAAALDVLVQGERPDASWSELLAALVREQHSEAAASALARIADGAGMSALLRAARSRAALVGSATRAGDGAAVDSTASDAAARALAIGLRRFGDALDDDVRNDALALLRALSTGERRLVLRALARDSDSRDELAAALRASDPKLRASAAIGARMLGDDTLAGAVRSALLRERDVEAVRRLC